MRSPSALTHFLHTKAVSETIIAATGVILIYGTLKLLVEVVRFGASTIVST